MRTLLACLLVSLGVNPVAAQKPSPTSPDEAHASLARLAGNWETHARFWNSTDPSAAPTECTATVKAQMIMGGRFLFQNVEGQCTGRPLEAIGVIGYDKATGRYEAASFSNMGTGISRHIGERNAAGDIVLHLSYQDQATGKMVQRRTVRSLISKNEWVETAYDTGNGGDQKVMEIRARRTNGQGKRP